jgi:CHAD domain-containing protein
VTAVAPTLPAFDTGLLAQPAHHGVRVVALARLGEIARGYELFLGGDPEGLHDVRVALRRLRTWLRAFAPYVEDTLKKKALKRLRELARATNDARDAEVGAAWLRAETDVAPRAQRGFRFAIETLEAERDAALHGVRARLARDLPALVESLTAQLSVSEVAPGADLLFPAGSMRDAASAAIGQQSKGFARALERAESRSDQDAAHRARIAAKRLRYVMEPLYAPNAARDAVASLIELQDLLGTARDAHLLSSRYVREVGEMAARDARARALAAIGVQRPRGKHVSFPRVRAGLIEIARRAHLAERRAFAAYRRQFGKRVLADVVATGPQPE